MSVDGENPIHTALSIVKIESAVALLGRDLGRMSETLDNQNLESKERDKKLDKLIELQLEQQHTSQALSRAFADIEEAKRESKALWEANKAETTERITAWAVWRTQISSVVDRWKGGMAVLWIVSAIAYALAGVIGKYYVDQQILNTSRIRAVELHEASKDPSFRPAP